MTPSTSGSSTASRRSGGALRVTPTDDNLYQTLEAKSHGILVPEVNQEVGEIIVAEVTTRASPNFADARSGGAAGSDRRGWEA